MNAWLLVIFLTGGTTPPVKIATYATLDSCRQAVRQVIEPSITMVCIPIENAEAVVSN